MTKHLVTAENSNLKVTVYWGDILYDVASIRPQQSVTIGESPNNNYVLDFKSADGVHSFELVKVNDDFADLKFDDSIKGHVRIKDSMISLAKARNESLVTKDAQGIYHYRLEKNDKADLVIGLVSFYFDWTGTEILPRASLFRDKSLVPIFFGLTLLLILALWSLEQLTPEPVRPPARVVSLFSRQELAKAAIGEKKSATGGAAKGELGKAALVPTHAESEAAKLKSANLGNLVSGLTAIGKEAPSLNKGDKRGTIAQEGTGGFSTEGLKQGGGGHSSGLGRTVGQGEGGFEGTGRLGLSGNAAHEGGTEFGPDLAQNSERGLDRDVIDAIIRRRQDRIRLCYERQLNFHPRLAGKVSLHFVIGQKGQVVSSRIIEDTMKSESVNKCILVEIASWTFPQPRGGVTVDVDYPFFFESSSKR